jgi:hypothetical protein
MFVTNSPDSSNPQAVDRIVVGAASTRGDINPAIDAACQATTITAGDTNRRQPDHVARFRITGLAVLSRGTTRTAEEREMTDTLILRRSNAAQQTWKRKGRWIDLSTARCGVRQHL